MTPDLRAAIEWAEEYLIGRRGVSTTCLRTLLDAVKQHNENVLRNVSSEWETTTNENEVTCHTRLVGGVLCRWWGDGPTPPGVKMIDAALAKEKQG